MLSLAGVRAKPVFLAVVLVSTAAGLLLPLLKDAGLHRAPFGQLVMAAAALAELIPVIMLSLLFSATSTTSEARFGSLMALLALLAVIGLALGRVRNMAALDRMLDRLEDHSGQLRVRAALTLSLAFAWLAGRFGFASILGAFAAGLLVKTIDLTNRAPHPQFQTKLEGIGFGFLVPVFFVTTGVQFDVRALVSHPAALAQIPLFLLALLVVRAVPALAYVRLIGERRAAAAGLMQATTLTFVIVATQIGIASGQVSPATGAALLAAGLLSATLFPPLAVKLLPAGASAASVHPRARQHRDGCASSPVVMLVLARVASVASGNEVDACKTGRYHSTYSSAERSSSRGWRRSSPGWRPGSRGWWTIEGDPGIGKTALVRRGLAQATGLKILSARGDQTETDLDFGLVDQLLRAAGDAVSVVRSTGGAGPAASSFAVGAHLLEVVGGQEAAGAVALVVDDLQWADRRSVEALTFMLRRLSVDAVLAVVTYRGPSDRLGEATQRLLRSVENRLDIPLGGLSPDEVVALAAALTAGRLDSDTVQWLYQGTGGHPLYLRTVLSDGSGFDPRAPGRLALPRSLAAAVGDYLRVLPRETRGIVEMLSVLNLRLPLAQLGEAAQVDSPGALIEPAVAAGLVDWWPEEPTCPVEIRHQLVREAIYADIAAARRRQLHARAASVVSESVSWEHRVAALDRPDEGLAAELEQLAGDEAAGFRLVLAATHLRWASDISPARADRERRLLTAALYLVDEAQDAALRPAVEQATPSPLRSFVLGAMTEADGQLAEAERYYGQALEQARDDPGSQPLAARIAARLAGTYTLRGEGDKTMTLGRWALGTGCLDPWAASQTRTRVAVGVSQAVGPREALAELGHLDADPAGVGLIDVDGLSWRGVFRLGTGDLGQAVADLTACSR